MASAAPSLRSLLDALPDKARLVELARFHQVSVPARATRDDLSTTLARSGVVSIDALVAWTGRDELRAACKQHGVAATSRARQALASALLASRHDSAPPSLRRALSDAPTTADGLPAPGAVALVRSRQYLVEDVVPGLTREEATRVDLVCLDDDAQGQRVSVLWELELGARVLSADSKALGGEGRVDPARTFAAYFHALKWSQVTATRADLFQSPFRAGIKLLDHQLTPLKKALELPRANLFIADDVGLGRRSRLGS